MTVLSLTRSLSVNPAAVFLAALRLKGSLTLSDTAAMTAILSKGSLAARETALGLWQWERLLADSRIWPGDIPHLYRAQSVSGSLLVRSIPKDASDGGKLLHETVERLYIRGFASLKPPLSVRVFRNGTDRTGKRRFPRDGKP